MPAERGYMDTKSIVNSAYHYGVLIGLEIGYSMLSAKVLNMKQPNLTKPDAMDFIRLTGLTMAAGYTKDMLVKKGIIPADIEK